MEKFFDNIGRFFTRITEDKLSLYAAQASFFIVFSVTPFIMLLITLLKYFVNIDSNFIMTEIYNHVPLNIAAFLKRIVDDIFRSSVGVISASAVSVLWLSSKGIMALAMGLDNIFRPEKIFNYFRERFLAVLYTLIFIFVLTLMLVVFLFGSQITEKYSHVKIVLMLSNIVKFRSLLFFILLTLTFASFYTWLPRNNSFIKQLPGAALAAIGWIVFSHIYALYIENYSNYSYVYGSLAAIMLLMLWLYICMNILLYGAEFNKLREENFFK